MAGRIAQAFVELTVKGDRDVRAKLGAVRRSVRAMGRDFDGSLSRLADGMDDATEGARKFQGAIGGILGIVTVVGAAAFKAGEGIYSLSQALRDGSEKAAEFFQTLNNSGTVDAARQNFEMLEERLTELNALLANRAAGSWTAAIEVALRGGVERVEQEVESLRSKQRQQSNQIKAEKERAGDAERKAQREAIALANEALQVQLLSAKAAAAATPAEKAQLETAAANLELRRQLLDLAEEQRRAEDIGNAAAISGIAMREALFKELNRERLLQIKAEQEAAEAAAVEEADTKIEEVDRVREATIRANQEAAEATRDALLDAARAVQEQQGGFSQLADLLGGIKDDIALLSRRMN